MKNSDKLSSSSSSLARPWPEEQHPKAYKLLMCVCVCVCLYYYCVVDVCKYVCVYIYIYDNYTFHDHSTFIWFIYTGLPVISASFLRVSIAFLKLSSFEGARLGHKV